MKMKAHLFFLWLAIISAGCVKTGIETVYPDNPNIAYIGRFDDTDKAKPVFMYSGCAIRKVFKCTSVELIMKDDSLRNMFTVVIAVNFKRVTKIFLLF